MKLAAEKEELERQARLFEPEIAQMYSDTTQAQCRQHQSPEAPVEPTRAR